MRTSTAIERPFLHNGRDLRLDFLRGLVMLVVICVHLEYLSFLSMFMWERLGLFSSAEGFVLFSGIVLGIVYKKRLFKEGVRAATIKLWRRAGQLYTVNVAVIISILLLQLMPVINVFEVTHWKSITGGACFLLFPEPGSAWPDILRQALSLEIGPHQIQIIGLYAELIAFSPVVLYALYKNKTVWVLLLSWSIYFLNVWIGVRLSHARFEYGFPSLSWQLVFFNGMVIGYHHQKVFNYLTSPKNTWLVYLVAISAFCFMILALNNPKPYFWPWHTAIYQDEVAYQHLYDTWFTKERLGFGRILNNIVFYAALFMLVSRFWQPCYRALGWLVVPIGQASLYVFVWHVYFVLLFSNTRLPDLNNIWINTGIHLVSIGLIWLMVKKRFLFAIVPR